jgi:hypothetical protein
MNSPSTSERGEHYPNAVVMPAAWFRSSMVVAASAVIIFCVRCVHAPRLPCEWCMRVSERAVRVREQRCLLACPFSRVVLQSLLAYVHEYMQCV